MGQLTQLPLQHQPLIVVLVVVVLAVTVTGLQFLVA
jgi:hypothetical protein